MWNLVNCVPNLDEIQRNRFDSKAIIRHNQFPERNKRIFFILFAESKIHSNDTVVNLGWHSFDKSSQKMYVSIQTFSNILI